MAQSPLPREPVHHLVVLREPYLKAMLAGRKRIECRLSKIRRPPFEIVRPGDLLWFKVPCGPIRGMAVAGRCTFVRDDDGRAVRRSIRQHEERICAEPGFFDGLETWARFLTLVWLERVVAVTPLVIRKSDRRAWVVLNRPPRPGMSAE